MVPDRRIEELDGRIAAILPRFEPTINRYRRLLQERGIYSEIEPTEFSIIPRVITEEEQGRMGSMCREITETAFRMLSDYMEDPSAVPRSPMNDFIRSLPRSQRVFTGVARYDLLKEGSEYKLIEANFTNAAAIRQLTESPALILELFPELKASLARMAPYSFIRRRLQEQGIRNVLILGKNRLEGDLEYLKATLSPVHGAIALEHESDYTRVSFDPRPCFGGERFDAVYPRYLSGVDGKGDALLSYRDLVERILTSGALVLDSWLTILLEDKDLRCLSRKNPRLEGYIPGSYDAAQMKGLSDYSDYVLKIRDLHGGKGVVVAPASVDIQDAVLQKRVYTNKYPVMTTYGNRGNATYDTGVHVSYVYDSVGRRLLAFDLAGFISRFSLAGDVVNISQGGGIIPVLVESRTLPQAQA